jgi:hypothetical protein
VRGNEANNNNKRAVVPFFSCHTFRWTPLIPPMCFEMCPAFDTTRPYDHVHTSRFSAPLHLSSASSHLGAMVSFFLVHYD